MVQIIVGGVRPEGRRESTVGRKEVGFKASERVRVLWMASSGPADM